MPTSLAVAIGGAVGALTRHLVDRAIEARELGVFPWATFTINITGCFVVGVFIAALVDRHNAPAWFRIGLVMGVVGGYTTFSTFAQESLDLYEEGRFVTATTYAIGSVVLGTLGVFIGSRVGRLL